MHIDLSLILHLQLFFKTYIIKILILTNKLNFVLYSGLSDIAAYLSFRSYIIRKPTYDVIKPSLSL